MVLGSLGLPKQRLLFNESYNTVALSVNIFPVSYLQLRHKAFQIFRKHFAMCMAK